ncbi:hypothetical protein Y032_0094g2702 [Ancylostoma ceylanicum]|uniref:Uncharacterized protein n=1 Tax=Ancylostoma ceylanicum TaxID=53326 RepID=A0A016TKV1_9BILA|nr:hypothetical protein Y032_0094g2702 [Ancylostoma ceylanicum]
MYSFQYISSSPYGKPQSRLRRSWMLKNKRQRLSSIGIDPHLLSHFHGQIRVNEDTDSTNSSTVAGSKKGTVVADGVMPGGRLCYRQAGDR